jgi:Zn-dependent peptidase ImmA (M78 family)
MSSILKELVDIIPVNVERLIRGHGINLNKNATSEEIGGGVNRSNNSGDLIGEIRKEGDQYKILILGSDHYYRKRFTMAHELGHFILHKDKIDTLTSIVDSAEYNGITEEEEKEAHAFAAETLMPEDKVREIYKETKQNQNGDKEKIIEEMSKMFQVSKMAMRLRLYLLDLINEY